MSNILNKYISVVDFLGNALGPNYEVSLYDLTKTPYKLIALSNGAFSGRNIGDPLTDLQLKVIENMEYRNQGFVLNSKGMTKGGQVLRDSTMFIQDDSGNLLGLFCISQNVSKYEKLSKEILNLCNMGIVVNEFEDFQFSSKGHSDRVETYATSAVDISSNVIQKTTEALGLPVERLSYEEKISIVKELEKLGVFLVKGAVGDVAALLKISEATMYRYIKQIHKQP